MQRVDIEVKPRALVGKDNVKKNLNAVRAEGWIPGTLYGHGKPESIVVNARAFTKAVHGSKAGLNSLFNVKTPTETTLAVVKELQRHYLRQTPLHVDFQRISLKEKLDVSVPTHVVGEAPGVKNDGGVLEHITREIRVRCLPDDIPASIDIDVSKLNIGNAIKVKDLPALKGVEVLTLAETIVVNVVAPKVEEVAAPAPGTEGAAAAAGTEPEVIAKGKKEEEGAEGAAKPAAGAAGAKGAAPAAAPAKGKEEKKK